MADKWIIPLRISAGCNVKPTIDNALKIDFLRFASRAEIVERISRLAAQLNAANGDSPELGQEYRERLKRDLRRLALYLWQDASAAEL
jgi:hypothetical protein